MAFNKSWLSKLHQQAWQDLKTRWRRSLFWIGCFLAFLGLCFSLAIIDTPSTTSWSFQEHTATACQPDGSFSLDSYDYKPWDASGFVQITLGFGTLAFTQAKVIDVVWDMVSLRVQEKRTPSRPDCGTNGAGLRFSPLQPQSCSYACFSRPPSSPQSFI
jgi:hypothetical protein